MKNIEENWKILSNELALPNDIFFNILHRYSYPFRYYHNIHHINDCLNEFEAAKHLAKDYLELKTAIWFHDIIYNTHFKNNEEKSAQLAKQILKQEGISQSFIQIVSNLILTTKHIEIPKETDSQLITDIDLAIFGAPFDKFDKYEESIRKEYLWVQENEYKSKRTEILRSFLKRPTIYTTEFFRNKYESQARENLERSLNKV